MFRKIILSFTLFCIVILGGIFYRIYDDMFITYNETKKIFYSYKNNLTNTIDFIISQKNTLSGDIWLSLGDQDTIIINGVQCTTSGLGNLCSTEITERYKYIKTGSDRFYIKNVRYYGEIIEIEVSENHFFSERVYQIYYRVVGPITEFNLSCLQQKIIEGKRYYKVQSDIECDDS